MFLDIFQWIFLWIIFVSNVLLYNNFIWLAIRRYMFHQPYMFLCTYCTYYFMTFTRNILLCFEHQKISYLYSIFPIDTKVLRSVLDSVKYKFPLALPAVIYTIQNYLGSVMICDPSIGRDMWHEFVPCPERRVYVWL